MLYVYNMVDNKWNVEIEFKELNMFVLQMEALRNVLIYYLLLFLIYFIRFLCV